MGERRQRRHSATALHFALSTATDLKRPIAPYISLWRAIGRVRAKYLHRLDMMISESPAINARRHKCELAGAQGMAAH